MQEFFDLENQKDQFEVTGKVFLWWFFLACSLGYFVAGMFFDLEAFL